MQHNKMQNQIGEIYQKSKVNRPPPEVVNLSYVVVNEQLGVAVSV